MYEAVCYETPFLKEVIVRIDFVAPIEELERTLPSKLAKVFSEYFPIIEPIDTLAQELQWRGDEVRHRQTRLKQWSFFGKDRDTQLALAAPYIFITYKQYRTFEQMSEQFRAVVGALGSTFPDVRSGRFGLRFVNRIDLADLASPTDWSRYISPGLLATQAFFAEPESLTRLIHIAELKHKELHLRFQFGMPNPDYPAIIKRPQFVLDLDGYIHAAHDLGESVSYLEATHQRIQALFEESITDALRERMHARPTASIQE